MKKQSEPTNNSSSKGETSQQLASNYLGNDGILIPEVRFLLQKNILYHFFMANNEEYTSNRFMFEHASGPSRL